MTQLTAEDLEAMLDEQTDKVERMKDLAEAALHAWNHGADASIQTYLNAIIKA